MSLGFTIDPQERSPLFRQLEDQVRYAVTIGELGPGDPLPSIRQVEAAVGINRNTVRRAYQNLAREGLLVLRQGREARVARRTSPRPPAGDGGPAASADSLALSFLQRAESEGVDACDLAEHLQRRAREHDAAYPRWACVECDPRQARALAGHVQSQLSRAVQGVDLHDLRRDAGALASSVRYLVTPHWHLPEVIAATERRGVEVFGVRMQLSAQTLEGLHAIAGRAVGVVVRDAESAPGFTEIVRRQIGASALRSAVVSEPGSLAAIAQRVRFLVFTTPCRPAVRAAATAKHSLIELVFEPSAQDIRRARQLVASPRATPNKPRGLSRRLSAR